MARSVLRRGRAVLKSSLWRLAYPERCIAVGARTVILGAGWAPTPPVAGWRPNWKADIIGRALAQRPGLFIDVGANIGQTMLDWLAGAQATAYLGFEPNPASAATVAAIIRRNGIPNATLVPAGLSDHDAVLRLHLRRHHGADAAATMIADLRPGWDLETIEVPVYRFDSIASGLVGDRPVSLVKIDVEGAEQAVLAGMRGFLEAMRVPILCEVLRRNIKADPSAYRQRIRRMEEQLSALGYRIFRLVKSQDLVRVTAFEPMAAFPTDTWAESTAEENDYLFAPPGLDPGTWFRA